MAHRNQGSPRENSLYAASYAAGFATPRHEIMAEVNQYEYYPFTGPGGVHPPAPAVDEAKMWLACPDVDHLPPAEAHLVMRAFEAGVRDKFEESR